MDLDYIGLSVNARSASSSYLRSTTYICMSIYGHKMCLNVYVYSKKPCSNC